MDKWIYGWDGVEWNGMGSNAMDGWIIDHFTVLGGHFELGQSRQNI